MADESLKPSDNDDLEELLGILDKLNPKAEYRKGKTVAAAIAEIQGKTEEGLKFLRLHQEVKRKMGTPDK